MDSRDLSPLQEFWGLGTGTNVTRLARDDDRFDAVRVRVAGYSPSAKVRIYINFAPYLKFYPTLYKLLLHS